jgi:hypothetical protein
VRYSGIVNSPALVKSFCSNSKDDSVRYRPGASCAGLVAAKIRRSPGSRRWGTKGALPTRFPEAFRITTTPCGTTGSEPPLAGYIKGATINLVPLRTQVGATADWSSGTVHKRDLSYSFLYNNNQAIQGSTEYAGHTLAYAQSITRSDDLSLSCSLGAAKNPGRSTEYSPACFVAWRHQLKHVPYFIIPERRGTIMGRVFRDDQSTGVSEGKPPMAEVEIMLDDRRRTLTRADGSYNFPNVHRGRHKIQARYKSRDPFFFTTESDLEVDENATVNFGIGYSLSSLVGEFLNDAGQGVPGVTVIIQSRGKRWTAVTEGDGSFFVSSPVSGDYAVQADEDSLPEGYSAETLGEPRNVTVGASAPGKANFTARAFRSISGRVLRYDPQGGQYVAVNHAQIMLRELGLTAMSDLTGRYMFRDLAAGSYTIIGSERT